jgi:hypothetical protein
METVSVDISKHLVKTRQATDIERGRNAEAESIDNPKGYAVTEAVSLIKT